MQQFIEALDKLTIGEPSTTETTDIIADKGEESLKIKRLRATIKHQADLILTLSDVYNAEAESNWKLYDQLSKLKAGKMGEINECIDRLHASALKMKEMAEGETEIITAYGTPCI